MPTSRAITRGSAQRGDGRRRKQADVPGGSGAATRRELLAIDPTLKGGITAVAKKAAKGGKKKGGKKR